MPQKSYVVNMGGPDGMISLLAAPRLRSRTPSVLRSLRSLFPPRGKSLFPDPLPVQIPSGNRIKILTRHGAESEIFSGPDGI